VEAIALDCQDIAVIIVAYRNRSTIGRCLAALERQTVRPREVLLLENGSPEGERVDRGMLPSWVNLVENEENVGFAAANNQLAIAAKSTWLALLNPDAFAHPDWLERWLQAVDQYPDFDLFGCTQYAADLPGMLDGVGDVYMAAGIAYRGGYGRPDDLLPATGEVFGPCGAATLIRRELFLELGGFDERFFCYNEDVDFAFKARLAGYRALQVSEAAIDHLGYASSGRRSDFAIYHGVRNRLWVFLRNMPGWLMLVMLPVHAVATFAMWVSAARYGQFKLFGTAIRDALAAWPRLMRERRDLQAQRCVSVLTLARAMAWNPTRLFTRAPHVRVRATSRQQSSGS
jgi:N-acetylglucosaminyl-diphospho-decaprenol L-rhamnosyltransferase